MLDRRILYEITRLRINDGDEFRDEDGTSDSEELKHEEQTNRVSDDLD